MYYFSFFVVGELGENKHVGENNDYSGACGACGVSLRSMAAGQFSLLPVSLLPR